MGHGFSTQKTEEEHVEKASFDHYVFSCSYFIISFGILSNTSSFRRAEGCRGTG
jgi:hypothetical protein